MSILTGARKKVTAHSGPVPELTAMRHTRQGGDRGHFPARLRCEGCNNALPALLVLTLLPVAYLTSFS